MVHAIGLSILKNRYEADDLVQEVFATRLPKLLQSEGDLEWENWGKLIARTARNLAIDVYRRKSRYSALPEGAFAEVTAQNDGSQDMYSGMSDASSDPYGDPESEREAKLQAELQNMEPTYHQVLTLKYMLKLTWEETAERLGLSVQGARKRAEKAKTLLATRMKGDH